MVGGAIADAFAALTSDRAWRKAVEEKDAVQAIVDGAGSRFHPELAVEFQRLAVGLSRSGRSPQ